MYFKKNKLSVACLGLSLAAALSACSVTAPRSATADPQDPWEGMNRHTQAFNDNLDDYVMKPLAQGYNWIMPDFAHHAVTNFFSNLDDIGVTANDALQGKLDQSWQDGARLLVNTTAGLGGFIDWGSEMDLPKHNEDFDQTLGQWGVGTGPYLVLPLFGPSSARGFLGLLTDLALNPISYTGIYFGSNNYVSYAVSGGLGVLKAVDTRSNYLGLEKVASEAALDRYDFFKNAYFERRNYLVNDGNVPEEDVLKFEEEKGQGMGPISPY